MGSSGYHIDFFTDLGEDLDKTKHEFWTRRCATFLESHEEAMRQQAHAVKKYCGNGQEPLKCNASLCMLENVVFAEDDNTCTDESHTLFIFLMLLQAGTDTAAKTLMALLRGEHSRFLPSHIDPYRLIAVMDTPLGIFVGWVPAATEAGDQVCLFRGAPFPFIVRAAKNDTLVHLGDACIPGLRELNDAEHKKEELDQRWVTLC